MKPIAPRPLRDVLRDFELRGKTVDKPLAEEAIAAVAADGKVTRDEVDALIEYGDGPVNLLDHNRKNAQAGWTEGTRAGRALFAGLSDTIEDLHRKANPNAARKPTNPFEWWAGGWAAALAPDQSPKVELNSLTRAVRERSVGWLLGSVDQALRDYPKANVQRNTYYTSPKPDVQRRIDALVRDWKAGKVADQVDLASPLRAFLERKYS